MKKFIICFIGFCTFHIYAQVKIGDNPTTINSNAILELESTNKGLLCPRVALNDVNSVSPLSGTVPEGMLIYNATGAEEHGFYNWDGSQWLKLLSDNTIRDNYVLVKSSADFPSPVSGVITLNANTLYELNGTIVLTDKLNLNGCTILGEDHMNDKLVYTPTSGELFTGAKGGTLKMLTISAPNNGSKLFNLDFLGNAENLIIQNAVVGGSNNLGNIANSSGYVLFTDIIFTNNTNGLNFEDINDLHLNSLYFKSTCSNTCITLLGVYEVIRFAGGSADSHLAQNSTILDITGITSLEVGALKHVLFHGDGTYVNGIFSSDWEVESQGLPTQKDDVATGNLYLTSEISNTFTAINTPVKVNGTTQSVNLFRTSVPTDNKIVYDGKKTRYFSVDVALSVLATAANKNYSFYIAKNGVVLPESKQTLRLASAVDRGSLSVSCNVSLSTNDYIELYVENNSDTTSLKVKSLNFSVK